MRTPVISAVFGPRPPHDEVDFSQAMPRRPIPITEAEALQGLGEYITKLGGSIELIAGWSARVVVRQTSNSSSNKVCDVYFYDTHGEKYRSKAEVGALFRLIERTPSMHGWQDEQSVNLKLWTGASQVGWTVHSTNDSHNTYVAPDGSMFKRKSDALAWPPVRSIAAESPMQVSQLEPAKKHAGVVHTRVTSDNDGVVAGGNIQASGDCPPKYACDDGNKQPPQPQPELKSEQRRAEGPPGTATEAAAEWWAARAIVGQRRANHRDGFEYLVAWEGSDEEGTPWPDSWEPEANCTQSLLDAYHSMQREAVPAASAAIGHIQAGMQPIDPSAASTIPEGMDSVRMVLRMMNLEQYASTLEEAGWDDLEFLLTLDPAALRSIAKEAGMKHGHALKFSAWAHLQASHLALER